MPTHNISTKIIMSERVLRAPGFGMMTTYERASILTCINSKSSWRKSQISKIPRCIYICFEICKINHFLQNVPPQAAKSCALSFDEMVENKRVKNLSELLIISFCSKKCGYLSRLHVRTMFGIILRSAVTATASKFLFSVALTRSVSAQIICLLSNTSLQF